MTWTPSRGMSVLVLVASLAGCAYYTTRPGNAPGRPTTYVDPATPGPVQGFGMESQDIISMTDRMMRDMLTNPTLAARTTRPPRVIVDAEYFRNESTNRINKNMLTDRLRVGLTRAASGRMLFVGRHYADMVEKERALKRGGVVDTGARQLAPAPAGGDYRLGGRITSRDAISQTGIQSRYHQIVFEMVSLETGIIVWSGMYAFKKAAQDDVIYR